jgi:CheY-like chemotaxis protein
MRAPGSCVLVIDDDRDVADLVHAVLSDEGYQVSRLYSTEPGLIKAAVQRVDPDCVLLDGESPSGFGSSWPEAARLRDRERRLPVIMFTADAVSAAEARGRRTQRSRAAAFAAVLSKPFALDDLVNSVADAIGRPSPMPEVTDATRTRALIERLRELGAREIRSGQRREWVTFRTADETLVQLYWWERMGAYLVGRYESAGGLQPLGLFGSLDAALGCVAALSATDSQATADEAHTAS